ncbi:hypothetical protein ACSSVW_000863 [Pseudoalteromonas sp. MBR-15]|jgi:hypothetical protein
MYQLYFSLALIFIIFSLPIYIYYITLKFEQFEDKGSSFFSLFFGRAKLEGSTNSFVLSVYRHYKCSKHY